MGKNKNRKKHSKITINQSNNMVDILNIITRRIDFLRQEFEKEFFKKTKKEVAEEIVKNSAEEIEVGFAFDKFWSKNKNGEVAEEIEVRLAKSFQKENLSLAKFDSVSAVDTLDGSTCVKEIVSKAKSKKSLVVYETLLEKVKVYNANIEKISINNLKIKILEWIEKENKFNETSQKIELDLKTKFGIKNINLLKGLIIKRPNFFERNLPFWLLPTRNSRDKSRVWTKLKKELKNENKEIDPGKYLSDKYEKKINEWNETIEKDLKKRGAFFLKKLLYTLEVKEYFKINNFEVNVEETILGLYNSKQELTSEALSSKKTNMEEEKEKLEEEIEKLEEQLENEVNEIKIKNKEYIFKLKNLLEMVEKEEKNYDNFFNKNKIIQQDEKELIIELYKQIQKLKDEINAKTFKLENLYKQNDIKVNWNMEVGPSKMQFNQYKEPENYHNITKDNFIPILKKHEYLIPKEQEENFKKLIEFKITQPSTENLNDGNIYQASKSAVKVTALGVTLAYEWPTRICLGKKEKDKVSTDKNPMPVVPTDVNKTFKDVKGAVNSIGQGIGI